MRDKMSFSEGRIQLESGGELIVAAQDSTAYDLFIHSTT